MEAIEEIRADSSAQVRRRMTVSGVEVIPGPLFDERGSERTQETRDQAAGPDQVDDDRGKG
jgi:hypothetical protein